MASRTWLAWLYQTEVRMYRIMVEVVAHAKILEEGFCGAVARRKRQVVRRHEGRHSARSKAAAKEQAPTMNERILNAISDAELERRWSTVRAQMAQRRIDALVMQNN